MYLVSFIFGPFMLGLFPGFNPYILLVLSWFALTAVLFLFGENPEERKKELEPKKNEMK